MRIRRSLLGPAVVTTLVASAAPAAANPMQDLRRGTALFVRVAHATVEGQPYSADYVPLDKPAGSLDLVLDATALGIDYDAVFHLTGTATGDEIVWTFDETPATPWDLGGGVRIHRVTGKLIGRVSWIGGAAGFDCGGYPCNYGVSVDSVPGTYVDIHGESPDPVWLGLVNESWVKSVHNPSFSAYGGLPRPALTSLEIAVPTARFCTATSERHYTGQVRLSHTPLLGGTWVDLMSSDPDRLSTRRLFISDRSDSARFTARFPPDYSGNLIFRAAAGGVMQSVTVSVDACLPSIDRKYLVEGLLEGVYPCSACIDELSINDQGDSAARVDGKWMASAAGGAAIELSQLLGADVKWAAVEPLGDLVARAKNASGKEVAIRIRDFTTDPKAKPEVLPDIALAFAHESGLLAGACQGLPCLWVDDMAKFPPLDPKAKLVDFTTTGIFLGNGPQGNFTRGVWGYRDQAGTLGSLGGNTEIAAVNESGTAVGWSETLGGERRAVYFDAKDWSKAIAVPLLPGAKHATAVGIGEDDTIVGTATFSDGSARAFLALPGTAAVALEALVGDPSISLRESLAITLDGAIVARGERQGKPEIFVIREK